MDCGALIMPIGCAHPLFMDTPLINEHRAAGAKLAEFNGCTLPERFSEFDREYRAAKQTVALFDTNWRAILVLTGRDRVRYLHAISSNDIQALENSRGTLALLLNPQGHILAEFEVYALPEKLLVLSHASLRERTVATLKKYVIGSHVHIDDQTDRLGSVAIEGPRAAEVIAEVCGVALGDLPQMSVVERTIDGNPCYLLRRSHFGEPGAEVITDRENLVAPWQKLVAAARARGGEPIGMAALNALRLEAGVPWFPVDFNDAMIPHEAAIETTHVSFNKGCYTGQEIVERVRSRGHVNRKRLLLKFSTATPPTPGTKLCAEDAEVGYVTSAAFSPAAGTSIGMGYVRREQFSPGSVVEFDGGKATVA
jgi:folate-binding protein YgfZ